MAGWWLIAACVVDPDRGVEPPGSVVDGAPTDTTPVSEPPDPTTEPAPTADDSVTDVFVQQAAPEVDALFVIDDSGSMADEQQALVESFPYFVDFFVGSGVDYHLGVVSTDMTDPRRSGKLVEVGGDRWIDDQTADPQAVFTAMASLGTYGSGTEAGLGAAFTALDPLADTYNAGFLREDSGLHVIVLSDEPDQTAPSLLTPQEFIDWFDGLRPDPAMRSFSSIVTLSGPARGADYLDVTQAIGGVVHDIADRDYADVLLALGVQAAGLQRAFTLSTLPDPATIEVEVDDGGVTLGFAEGDDWSYDPTRNDVTFLAYVPPSGAVVRVHYEPATR